MCVLERLEIEIEAGRLGVRKDCCVESDLGLRQRLLDMLFCYNPVWLKLGLEVCERVFVCVCGGGGRGVEYVVATVNSSPAFLLSWVEL